MGWICSSGRPKTGGPHSLKIKLDTNLCVLYKRESMGQYTKFRKQLPRTEKVRFADDGGDDWMKKVQARKATLAAERVSELGLAHSYVEAKSKKEGFESEIRACNLEMAAIERLLAERFEDSGIEKVETVYGNFSLKDDPVVEIFDQEAFYAWIRSTPGGEDLFKVYAQTANTLVKDALINGKPLPPGTKVNMNIGINYRKGKSDE